MFTTADFIEYPDSFHREHRMEDPAPVFRRQFAVRPGLRRATLSVCGLGYGYWYLNGEPVTEDLFTAPVSDYTKTVWFTVYDVTGRLTAGDNLLAVILGNGFYNESLSTAWDFDLARWRGAPKCAAELELVYDDGVLWLYTDEEWKGSLCSPVRYNQLRAGETYDTRIGEDWRMPSPPPGEWKPAVRAAHPPTGVLRECTCQPIRVCGEYPVKAVTKLQNGHYILDFGQNLSGFLRVDAVIPAGRTWTFRHAERVHEDGTLEFNGMNDPYFYKSGDFQTDRLIGNGQRITWSPRFTYHGFRYVEIEGMEEPPVPGQFTALFVHQDVTPLSAFFCSDPIINEITRMARMSCLSNMFYMLTDCPTREKLGWMNDAQASMEQLVQNYDIAPLLCKWVQDMADAMNEQGDLPGIVPTGGWGYEWGGGPVSTGALFELCYQLFRQRDDGETVRRYYPVMERHMTYILAQTDCTDGLIGFGLPDWSLPFDYTDQVPTPLKFSTTLLAIKYCRYMTQFAGFLQKAADVTRWETAEKKLSSAFRTAYLNADGTCRVTEQTALAMMIVLGLYDDLSPLKDQLLAAIGKWNGHLFCGMVGQQYLFDALDICGRSDLAYDIITAPGHPSYREWINEGATTLCECWGTENSNNHHMLSCVIGWFDRTLVGFRPAEGVNGYREVWLTPAFVPQLDHCMGRFDTVSGQYVVAWRREPDGTVTMDVTVPENGTAVLRPNGYRLLTEDTVLTAGQHTVRLEQCIIHNA